MLMIICAKYGKYPSRTLRTPRNTRKQSQVDRQTDRHTESEICPLTLLQSGRCIIIITKADIALFWMWETPVTTVKHRSKFELNHYHKCDKFISGIVHEIFIEKAPMCQFQFTISSDSLIQIILAVSVAVSATVDSLHSPSGQWTLGGRTSLSCFQNLASRASICRRPVDVILSPSDICWSGGE